MEIIDAIWEKANIDSRVVEIIIEKGDSINDFDVDDISAGKDYVVVKVPTDMTDYNWFLGSKGFVMIETQLGLSKKIKDLDINDRYLKRLLPKVSYEIVTSEKQLNIILDRITPTMFVTDRISLDPTYGVEIGCKRYKKYIWNSFVSQNLEIIGIFFNEDLVGFEMHKILGDVCYGKLGGVFSDVKIPGLGFLTACAPLLFAYEKYGVKEFRPDISTNNTSVLGLYNYFHFNIDKLTYVFVKHNDN